LSESEDSEAEDSLELDVAGSEAEAASDGDASEDDAQEAEASDEEASDEEASEAPHAKTSMVRGGLPWWERVLVSDAVHHPPAHYAFFLCRRQKGPPRPDEG
jgi:hypothetical protein